MNGVDYSKRIAKERDFFKDIVKKNTEATDKKVNETEDRTKKVINEQADKFVKDKSDIENTFNKKLANIKEKTQNDFSYQATKNNDELNKQRDEFNRASGVQKKDFDQRLNEITSSYKRAFDAEKEHYANLTDAQKKRYDRNVQDLNLKKDRTLKLGREHTAGAVDSLKDDFRREQGTLVRNQENQLKAVQNDEFKKRNDLKNIMNLHTENTHKAHQAQLNNQRENAEETLNTVNEQFKNYNNAKSEDFGQKMKNFAQSQKNESLRTNREHQKLLSDMALKHNKELTEKGKALSGDDGSSAVNDIMAKQKGLEKDATTKNKIRHLQNELVEGKRLFQEKAQDDQDNFNETFKTERKGATTLLEKKLNQERGQNIQNMTKAKNKFESDISNRDYQTRLDRQNFDREVSQEKKSAQARAEKMKESYDKVISELEEKNKFAIGEISKTAKQDKDLFTKKVIEARNQEVYELKREFSRMMDSTIQDYEKRLGDYKRESQYMKLTLEQKLQNVTDQAEKKMETQRNLFSEMRNADLQNQQILNDQRDHDYKTSLNKLSSDFQKKIDKLQIDSDTKLKLLTNDYENKLKEVTASKSKDMAQKDIQQVQEMSRLKKTFEDEKNRVIAQYESQIVEMKKGYDNQMQELKTFKNIS